MRLALRARHYSSRTEKAYLGWIKRFIRYHGVRHPAELGSQSIAPFLTHLAAEERVAASTQNQALAALLFLYRNVLGWPEEELQSFVHAKRPQRLPDVLSVSEVAAVLAQLHGPSALMGALLYRSGLRLMECVRLRVKDLNFERGELLVRQGKGGKDRVTPLPRKFTAGSGRSPDCMGREGFLGSGWR